MFINYTNKQGITVNSYRAAGAIACSDMTDFLDSVLNWKDATCSDTDIDSAMEALEDGEFLESYPLSNGERVGDLHFQLQLIKEQSLNDPSFLTE